MIGMRKSTGKYISCVNCKKKEDEVIQLFDLKIDSMTFTICDECNEKLFKSTLNASCLVNSKLKTKRDLNIINARRKKC